MNTGSPHYVEFVKGVKEHSVFEEGRKIRYNERFKKKGTNVNFVEKIGKNKIFVRTYERGVENETYSCGTGVTAAAIAASLSGMSSPVQILTLGGELCVSFDKEKGNKFTSVFLIGPAVSVYKGTVEI